MVALVTVTRVKQALRIEHDDDDAMLEDLYIPAASDAVIDHLKAQAEALLDLDSGGNLPEDGEVPEAIQMATILLVANWYDKPFEGFADNELPAPVKAILRPLRDPALA